jgi:hypothetical protein
MSGSQPSGFGADPVCPPELHPSPYLSPPNPKTVYYIIKWTSLYYLGYTTDTDAMWTRNQKRATILHEDEIITHLALLTKVELLPQKEIEILKVHG